MNRKQCFLIFGMHRSGTSAFAGLLNQLGISMGDLKEAGYDNPKGFFENRKVVQINDEILSEFGQSWDDEAALPIGWLKLQQMEEWRDEIKRFLQKAFKGVSLFAIKDPRFSLTLPLWQPVFESLGIEIKQFLIIRHPYEVAQSLYKRNHFTKQQSLALWMKYMMNAEINSREHSRFFINFESILNEPIKVIHSIGLEQDLETTKLEQLKTSFINKQLRHHQNTQPIEETLLTQVYHSIKALTNGGTKEILADLDTIRQSADYQAIISPAPLVASLMIDNGKGFAATPAKRIAFQVDQSQFVFQLPKEGKTKRLQFYPCNKLAAIEVQDVQIITAGQPIAIKKIAKTPLLEYGNTFIFDKEGFIELELPSEIGEEAQLRIDLKYLKIGEKAHEIIQLMGFQMGNGQGGQNGFNEGKATPIIQEELDTTSFWLSFIKTAFSSPSRFLKQLNVNNFRKLQRALVNESPTMILINLKKLLKNGNQTELVDNKAIKPLVLTKPISKKHKINNSSLALKSKKKAQKLGEILYVFQDLPDYDQSSGGKRATRILELLTETFEVYVFSLGEKPQKYIDLLSTIGVKVLETHSHQKVKKQVPAFTAIIYSIYRNYQESKRLKKLYPKAKIIIDSVDVNWLREQRSIGIWEGLSEERVAKNKKNEIAAYKEADLIWAVTTQDKAEILKEIPTADVRVVSNIHEPIFTKYEENGTNNLLFIGSYHHYPNISAVKKLALEIFPKVRAAIADAQLIIAGSNAPTEVKALAQQSNVQFRGYVEEGEMDDLYKEVALTVSPLLAGAGIKGKICESIAYMTPVVTNDIGNEGINLKHEEEGLIVPVASMAAILIKALRRDYNFAEMTVKAQEKLFKLVGPKVVQEAIVHSIFPKISVCIVTWNGIAMLKKCIESIEKHTVYPNYKIIVYSNACTDGTTDYLKKLSSKNKKIIPILATENEVFVRPNNKMMQLFPEEDIVLLNNDVYVTPNWLYALYKTAYGSSKYGVAGAKILYPDGSLQEFGAEIYKDGTGQNIGKGDNPDLKRYTEEKEVGYVSGCAMYIKRSTIQKIGVFDEQFHPCYFEDSDYCYRAKEYGLKTAVSPNSIVYHEEGATAGTDSGSGFKQYQEINKAKFLAKHKSKLRN